MPTLDELVARHRAERNSLSQRALAELELQIRKACPVRNRAGQAERWMAVELGGTSYEYTQRYAIICADGAEALWQRIENGLPVGTAVRLIRGIRSELGTRSKRPAVMREALAAALARYDHLPLQDKPEPGSPGPTGWSSDKEFWPFLRKHILAFVDQNLMDMPELERDTMSGDFERDLDALFRHHQQRWYRARQLGSRDAKVSRRKLEAALAVLHMDLPRRGADLKALLAQARRQQRELARLYHPDTNRGHQDLRRQYEAVISSYDVVERWVQAQGVAQTATEETEPRTSLRVVQGGKKE